MIIKGLGRVSESPQSQLAESTTPTGLNKSHLREPSVYRSAVDWWLAVLLSFPILAAAMIGVVLMANDRPADASSMFLTATATLLVTGVFVVPCRYTFLNDALSIRCGVICYQVSYDSIRDIKRSSTLRSGPAMSLRRVAIQTDRREYIVSPVRREQFMDQLKRHSTHLHAPREN